MAPQDQITHHSRESQTLDHALFEIDGRMEKPSQGPINLYSGIGFVSHVEDRFALAKRLYDELPCWPAARAAICFCDVDMKRLLKTTIIAIVDDDESVREAVSDLVESLGYDAIAFERAADLLKSDQRSSVACLIADVQMPGMTGPDLYNRLVASGQPIPTILITAYPDHAVKSRALQNGIKCYLTKPFREEDLLACIQSALGSRSAQERHADEE